MSAAVQVESKKTKPKAVIRPRREGDTRLIPCAQCGWHHAMKGKNVPGEGDAYLKHLTVCPVAQAVFGGR
jgi:hypothetical protein